MIDYSTLTEETSLTTDSTPASRQRSAWTPLARLPTKPSNADLIKPAAYAQPLDLQNPTNLQGDKDTVRTVVSQWSFSAKKPFNTLLYSMIYGKPAKILQFLSSGSLISTKWLISSATREASANTSSNHACWCPDKGCTLATNLVLVGLVWFDSFHKPVHVESPVFDHRCKRVSADPISNWVLRCSAPSSPMILQWLMQGLLMQRLTAATAKSGVKTDMQPDIPLL